MNKFSLILTILSLLVVSYCSSNQTLQVDSQTRQFKILQLTDIHYGMTALTNMLNIAIQTHLIEKSKPNFVAVSGDVIEYFPYDIKHDFVQRLWKQFQHSFNEAKMQYSICLGNHDQEANLSPRQIAQLDSENPYSHTQVSPENVTGGTNYWLPIYSSYDSSKVIAIQWFLDTHARGCMNSSTSYGCIEPSQIQWFQQEMDNLIQLHGSFLSIVFFHIPIQQYSQLYNTQPVYGTRGENICCPKIDTGFFQVLSQYQNQGAQSDPNFPGIHAFIGHDHDNDFGGFLEGVELVYGRKTGFGSYGPRSRRDMFMERGGRVLTIQESKDSQGNIQTIFSHKVIVYDGKEIENGQAYKRSDINKSGCDAAYGYDKYDPFAKRYTSDEDITNVEFDELN